jgi:hypothetical protein
MSLPRALHDVVDANLGVRLPMPLRFLVVLAPAQLEDLDLVAAPVRHDRGIDLGARDERGAHLDGIAGADQQHLAEGDLRADLAREGLDPDLLAGLHLVLLAARFDDCVHGTRLPGASPRKLVLRGQRLGIISKT